MGIIAYEVWKKMMAANRTPEQVAYDNQKVRAEARRVARNKRNAIKTIPHPPEHYIESRTEAIRDSRRHLVMFPDFREGIEADIRNCEAEIRYAEHRLNLGLTDPY